MFLQLQGEIISFFYGLLLVINLLGWNYLAIFMGGGCLQEILLSYVYLMLYFIENSLCKGKIPLDAYSQYRIMYR
jgi:hypothetical protein